MSRWLQYLWLILLTAGPLAAEAQQASISRYARFTGNINFVVTGGSLRTQPNTGNACTVGATSTQTLNGVPGGASIVAAYLYWGGSGATVDGSVSFNGATVTASRTFQATFSTGGTDFPFFGGFADVTARVPGNGSFTFGGLTVNTGAPHCGSQAVAAGWGLVVIYGSPSERLRAVNVFDGLQWFRGSALNLTPDGFRIPASNIDGRMAIVAWEGDPQNSTALNGFSEALTFNGAVLQDGINVAGSDPLLQPYDGTVNSVGVSTSYGVDVDTFDVSSLLSPGQTSATTVFSAGGDLVLLAAQVVSATSEPVVDLSIGKTHAGSFTAGANGTYTLRVANAAGAQREDNPIVVTDTLPAGLTFVSGTGTGWTCAAVGQDVTCTRPPPLNAGASAPDLTLTVAVGAAAAPGVTNTAQVTSASFDSNPANDSASDPTVVLAPDLSTSTKSVVDLNGGEVDQGDTLRYTITVAETAGVTASGVRVTDDIPADVTGFSVVSRPPGAVDASTGAGTGANGAGFLDVGSISVPAGGSADVVFDVVVAGGVSPGATIDNVATVLNPFGPGATPAAPQLVVSPSRIPANGAKPLYLRRNPGLALSRVPASAPEGNETIAGGGSATWTLSPALQQPFTVPAGSVSVRLWLTRAGGGGANRTVQVTLANSVTGTVGTATQTVRPPSGGTPAEYTFVIGNAATTTFPPGSSFSLTVALTSGNGGSLLRVYPRGGGAGDVSRVVLDSTTVINVDAVSAYDAAWPGGSTVGAFAPGATVHARAVVSDPFGTFDISAVRLTILDPTGAVALANQPMAQVADSGAASATYAYAYVVPPGAASGAWTLRVVADEGTEGTVSDLGVGAFVVQAPTAALWVQKTSMAWSDPLNGTTAPRRIPGGVVRYAITVTNTGPGPVDANSLLITDPLPPGAALYVAGVNAIEFLDGTPPSGLTWNAGTAVSYSNQPGGGAPYSYTPTADAEGFDANVTGLRIAPSGTLAAAGTSGTPGFTVRFRIRLP